MLMCISDFKQLLLNFVSHMRVCILLFFFLLSRWFHGVERSLELEEVGKGNVSILGKSSFASSMKWQP